MLHNEIHSAHEINPDNRSISGSFLEKPKGSQSNVDQDQMVKMFEMFQQMQAAQLGNNTTAGSALDTVTAG